MRLLRPLGIDSCPAPPLHLDMDALLRSGLPECIACRDPFDGLSGPGDTVVNRIVVLQIDKQRPADQMAEALFEIQQLDMVRVFVLFDKSVDILNNGLMLWKVFNNVSPDRDMVIKKGRMVIDACRKGPVDGHTREWPDELTFDI